MSDDDVIREQVVQTAAQLLRDKPEAERKRLMRDLDLTPGEQEAVLKLLWEPPPPPPPSPEELRETETFQRLVEDVRRGKAVLFLGAGVSMDVDMPSSGALVDAIRSLAQSYQVPIDEKREYDLPAIAGLAEREGLRGEVIQTIKDRIDKGYRQKLPPYRRGFYRLLPYLGQLKRQILTTNWDDLIERAFLEAGEPVVTIRRDRDLRLIPAADHVVVKLHGDFADPASLIVSDTDYSKARGAIAQPGGLSGSLWGMVSTLLAQNSCIFAGFRMGDEDMNLLRTLVAARQLGEETRNYMVGPFDESEQQGLKDWLRMGVIAATSSEFFVALAQELAEFANRQDDLDRIFRREAAPFLEFYASFGAGKHALLDEIERRARGVGWKAGQIIRVDLCTVPPSLTAAGLTELVATTIGQRWIGRAEQLAQVLKNKGRLLLLFENTEAVEEGWDQFTAFVGTALAPVVRELDEKGQTGQRSQLILSGRYPVEGWPFTFKRYAEVFPLSPFTLNAVREMAVKYTLFQDPRAAIDHPSPRLVEQIHEFTGRSHPGFIKEILDDLMKKSKKPGGGIELPPSLTEQEVDGYLASFVESIREEVWADAPQEIAVLFTQGLCVLRRLNASLLARLAQEEVFSDLFTDVGGPEDIIHSLRKCHLLSYEFPLEEVDPIIRRIQSQVLRRNKQEPERFALVQNAVASSWKGLLTSVEDLTQLHYFREWLYHKASYLQQDDDTEAVHWRSLQADVEGIPFRSSEDYPVEMGRTLLEDIEERKERDGDRDGELFDSLLNCLGETYYEDFRQLLIGKQSEVTL